MTLTNAADVFDELAAGRLSDSKRIWMGVNALDPLLGHPDCDLDLIEAAATLDLDLAQGIAPYHSADRRTRASHLAAAVRKALKRADRTDP